MHRHALQFIPFIYTPLDVLYIDMPFVHTFDNVVVWGVWCADVADRAVRVEPPQKPAARCSLAALCSCCHSNKAHLVTKKDTAWQMVVFGIGECQMVGVQVELLSELDTAERDYNPLKLT